VNRSPWNTSIPTRAVSVSQQPKNAGLLRAAFTAL